MRYIANRLLLVLCLLAISALSRADASPNTTAHLLQLSGISRQVEEFPRLIKEGMLQSKQTGNNIKDDTFNAMLATVDDSLNTSAMLEEIGRKLGPTLNNDETKVVLSWYESRPGKLITAAEEHASTPEAYNEMIQQSDLLMKDRRRIDYARSLDELLGATQFTLDLHTHTQLAVISAFSSALEPDTQTQLEIYKAQVKQQVESLRTDIEQFVILSFLYSYQAIGDDDLKRYREFLETPEARTFNRVTMQGISETLQRAIAVLAKRIAEIKIDKPVSPGVGKDDIFI